MFEAQKPGRELSAYHADLEFALNVLGLYLHGHYSMFLARVGTVDVKT